MIIKYLIVSWHQNNLEINGISGVGTEKVAFFISHYSFLAAKSNSDSAISHIIKAQRHSQSYQLFYTIIILTIKYTFWRSIVK